MNNLLSYNQKINRRNKKNSSFKKNTITKISGQSFVKMKQSYRPFHKSNSIKRKNPFFSSIRGQYLLLPKQLINHLPQLLKKERKSSLKRFFLNLSRFINRKFLTNGFIFIAVFGLILASSISSAVVLPADGLIMPRDISLDIILESYLSIDDNSGKKAFGDVDLSLVRGFKITEYKIKQGDSLSVIANKHKIDIGTLISFNNIKNAKMIQAGTLIKIPDTDGLFYRVKRGDSLGSIALNHNVALNNVLDINNIESEVITPGQELFIPGVSMNSFDLKKALGELFLYPAAGRLTSGYGYRNDPFTGKRRMHYGIDIANRTGTVVKATLDGTVIMCGFSTVYGKYIILKHQGGYQSLYAHLDAYRVKEGEKVGQGQIIGELGNSGRSTGPHLHFSIYHNQQPVNPLSLLHS